MERRGARRYGDGTLAVQYDDATTLEWEIAFSDAGATVLAGGKPWQRVGE